MLITRIILKGIVADLRILFYAIIAIFNNNNFFYYSCRTPTPPPNNTSKGMRPILSHPVYTKYNMLALCRNLCQVLTQFSNRTESLSNIFHMICAFSKFS